MKIQVGEIYMSKVTGQKIPYPNKTHKYLMPCLREYGEIFSNRVSDVFKVAIGLGDVILDRCGIHHEKHLFLLLDSTHAPNHFKEFIPWIRTQSAYEDDYAFGELQKSTFHMVILKFPERLYDAYETFKRGEFSMMFDEDTINDFFVNHPGTRKVLVKDNQYRIHFVDEVNELYGTIIAPEEFIGELDFSVKAEEETFNDHLK